jgi:D-arabinose 1-dehydrogenase-like Zn-dependent alcohol dehydrogenase
MIHANAYAAPAAAQRLGPHEIDRRDVGPEDILIDVAFCGVCHSDLHQVRDEWGQAAFPMVPGHEIIGRAAQVGGRVRTFKPGDLAGVGCMVDSCRACPSCAEHNLGADVELIPVQDIDQAYERMLRGDMRYRFVLDIKTLWASCISPALAARGEGSFGPASGAGGPPPLKNAGRRWADLL